MTDREAMKQALEALSWTDEWCPDGLKEQAIAALRERLAQPEQEEKSSTAGYVKKIESLIAERDALRERLAQPEQDWDWRHPKAQALIGAKARLEIKLRLVEQLVEDPNFETTASDMEYWEPLHDKLQGRLAQPEQEPVAWVTGWHDGHCVIRAADPALILPIGAALYTTPPQRKPLTDDVISDIWCKVSNTDFVTADTHEFARAIEAAHGIKEQP